jgi:hypothetical protein
MRRPTPAPPGCAPPESARPPSRRLAREVTALISVGGALLRTVAEIVLGTAHPGTLDVERTRPAPATDPYELSQVAELIYELLDAHDDTSLLASELELDPIWGSHLEYLRALQRHGREAMARMSLDVAA